MPSVGFIAIVVVFQPEPPAALRPVRRGRPDRRTPGRPAQVWRASASQGRRLARCQSASVVSKAAGYSAAAGWRARSRSIAASAASARAPSGPPALPSPERIPELEARQRADQADRDARLRLAAAYQQAGRSQEAAGLLEPVVAADGSDPAGAFQDEAEMRRNFLPWKRPEGRYPERDGRWIIVAPTVPASEMG